MNTTNKAYYAYDLMMRGYQTGDLSKGYDHPVNILFRDGAVRLAASHDMAAWPNDCMAAKLLYEMKMCFYRWQQPNVDRRVNRIRLLAAAEKLAQLKMANPFVYPTDAVLDDPDTVSLDAMAEVENMMLELKPDEDLPAHFMGVLPDEE